MSIGRWMVLFAAPALPAAFPGVARAHTWITGYTADEAGDPNRSPLQHGVDGLAAVASGWGHVLLIGALVLIAGSPRARQAVALFAAGLAATLIAATLAALQPAANLVDAGVALTVAAAGLVGLGVLRGPRAGAAAALLAAGAIHGLALALRVQERAPIDGVRPAGVLAFAAGALAAVAAIAAAATLLRRLPLPAPRRPASVAVLASGLLAAVALPLTGEKPPAGGELARDCVQQDLEAPRPGPGAEPAAKAFFAPGEKVADAALERAVADGVIVVRYRTDIAADDVDAIEALSGGEVVAAPARRGQAPALVATTSHRRLVCGSVRLDRLADFREYWLAFLRGRQQG